jgi:hypothetical protein
VFKYYTNLLRESRFRTHIQKSLKDYSGNHITKNFSCKKYISLLSFQKDKKYTEQGQ